MPEPVHMKWCSIRHGSDLFEVYWDAAEGRALRAFSGTYVKDEEPEATAKPTGIVDVPWTAVEARRARAWLLDALKSAPLEPDSFEVGQRVALIGGHKNETLIRSTEPCKLCAGTGTLANPRKRKGTEPCRTCKGEGTIVKNLEKVRDDAGNQVYEAFEPDSAGVVTRLGKDRGTLPARSNNLDVFVTLDDGREMKCPVRKLRLERAPEGYGQFLKEVEAQADAMDPTPFLGFRASSVEFRENKGGAFLGTLKRKSL
ncbi:hypothetical protein EP7_004430 [Isosphaeraceae bacterium EP7]